MQKNQWNQYPNAYSKDNSRYTYKMDDGSAVTLTAGKDGVTEDWIARLKKAHIEEMNLLRCGRSKGAGKNKLLSLTQFEDETDDKSSVLIDPNSDVEANLIAELEAAEKLDRLQKALESLTPEQRDLLYRVRVKGVQQNLIAVEEGVNKMVITRRMKKIDEQLRKFF